jgi:hypothetical protein
VVARAIWRTRSIDNRPAANSAPVIGNRDTSTPANSTSPPAFATLVRSTPATTAAVSLPRSPLKRPTNRSRTASNIACARANALNARTTPASSTPSADNSNNDANSESLQSITRPTVAITSDKNSDPSLTHTSESVQIMKNPYAEVKISSLSERIRLSRLERIRQATRTRTQDGEVPPWRSLPRARCVGLICRASWRGVVDNGGVRVVWQKGTRLPMTAKPPLRRHPKVAARRREGTAAILTRVQGFGP